MSISTLKVDTFAGSIDYMAPEQIKMLEYNEPADIWSMGITFYQLCFKKLPDISLLE